MNLAIPVIWYEEDSIKDMYRILDILLDRAEEDRIRLCDVTSPHSGFSQWMSVRGL